jgi:hypothetical protein
MEVQLRDMTKWMTSSQIEFALVSSDVGHPLYDVPRRKLYFFIMEPTGGTVSMYSPLALAVVLRLVVKYL